MAGLYIHIPFCKQACHYCDFHFSTNLASKENMVAALVNEITLQQNYLGNEVLKTIYFGGGTPSLLSHAELKLIFEGIRKNFQVHPEAEITLEANPDDLSFHTLVSLKSLGVNRLSIGIQSFDDDILKYINRAHTGNVALQCVDNARKAGFKNISIDLIYAIPNQNLDAWQNNIDKALMLSPQHISSYSLTIENKTVFGRWSAQGKLKPIDDDVAAEQLELLMEKLDADGFDQYEVSNFGKPGFYSSHNSSYWRQEKYLGIGPSAHSYNGVSRQYNIDNNFQYLHSITNGTVPFQSEILSRADLLNEYLLTTLRTQWGSDLVHIKNLFAYDLVGENMAYLDALHRQELIIINEATLALTKKGRLLADKIASDLFLLDQ